MFWADLCSPPNLYVEVLISSTSNVDVIGDELFQRKLS